MVEANESAGAKDAAQERQMVRTALATLLEPAAYERLMIVKSQNPQAYSTAAQWIISVAQSGRLKGKIGEPALREVLLRISGQKRQGTIEFRRKGE